MVKSDSKDFYIVWKFLFFQADNFIYNLIS